VTTRRETSPGWCIAELLTTGFAILTAAAGGAELFALSATERWTFQYLLVRVGLPAVALLILVLVTAAALQWYGLVRGIAVGAVAGAIATLGLEAVRITGFRVLHTMPGDLPTPMGVKATGRIMVGPNTTSTLIGYLDHYWNGALFGVIFALIVGNLPAKRGGIWAATLIGIAYGLALGYGFLSGPVPRTLGVGGIFSTVSVGEFRATVYLAHAVFGAALGALVHRFAAGTPPVWIRAFHLIRAMGGHHTDARSSSACGLAD
jgi:hypothetical protein